jgi:hypothetical protein
MHNHRLGLWIPDAAFGRPGMTNAFNVIGFMESMH